MFKLNQLDKFLKEDEYEDEPMVDVGSEMEKFADRPEEELAGEEGAVPLEDIGFEMEQEGDGLYTITHNGENICRVSLTCNGEPIDMATVENPTECEAVISDIIDLDKTAEYRQKLKDMGFIIEE